MTTSSNLDSLKTNLDAAQAAFDAAQAALADATTALRKAQDAYKKATTKAVFVCGTRAVYATPRGTFRVVCATCNLGTTERTTLDSATAFAVRYSARRCYKCGAS